MEAKILCIGNVPAEKIIGVIGTPTYVLDLDIVKKRISRLQAAFPLDRADIYFSVKSNANFHLLKVIQECALGIDACSVGDLWIARRCGFSPERISFTGVGLSADLLRELIRNQIEVNLDSLSEFDRCLLFSETRTLGLRVAPEVHAGFSEHCRGGEWGGKLGVDLGDVPDAIEKARRHGVKVRGLHMHIGSGILEPTPILTAAGKLLQLYRSFSELEYLNIGGGFGTSYHDDELELSIGTLADDLFSLIDEHAALRGKTIRLKLEPGEFIAAPAGWLLTRVMVKKIWQRGPQRREIIILDASMNHFPGGVLYGSQNRIFLCSNIGAQRDYEYLVCGNTNQSGDHFGGVRQLPLVMEGDLLALGSCGSYAASRASTFNEHVLAPEVICSEGRFAISTSRQSFEELFGRIVPELNWIPL